MKRRMTGEEFMRALHKHRQQLWEDAKRRGLTMEQFIAEIEERGREIWQQMKQRAGTRPKS